MDLVNLPFFYSYSNPFASMFDDRQFALQKKNDRINENSIIYNMCTGS